MSPKKAESNLRRALDLWEPPANAGEPQVCVASSFTFHSTFFETECLGRFLQMDTHPAESEAVGYLIEREEKLAAARVCALVDRRHARDKESLRWDVLGVIVPGGIQHSKVSLLAWANHVRVIIGSGNLTQPGYRKNLEVFGTIEANKLEGNADRVEAVLQFLERLVGRAVGSEGRDTPKGRTIDALRRVQRRIANWPSSEDSPYPLAILGEPGNPVVKQLFEAWPSGAPVRTVSVLSPFFDLPGKDRTCVEALINGMAQRRPRKVDFYVRAEPLPDGRTRVFAPLGMVRAAGEQCEATASPVDHDQAGERRDFHAKMIQLENEGWSGTMIGSSNFTAAGLGVSKSGGNVEANLFYAARATDPLHDNLYGIWPEATTDEFDLDDSALIWEPEAEELESGGDLVPLPATFQEAIFAPGEPARLQITLVAPLPKVWSIRVENGRTLLTGSRSVGEGLHDIPWTEREVPLVLEVAWESGTDSYVATWPVNVSNPADLAPPEELRNLTLEELLEILSSTRSLPVAVTAVLRRRKRSSAGGIELDPLKRFDSQATLLRRTKRVAAALDRLKERLERPALTRDAFEWRLKGAIGPMRLADAFAREATLPGEARFYLAELALALGRVRPARPALGGLSAATISKLLSEAVAALRQMSAATNPDASAPMFEQYVDEAFTEAAR